MSDEGNAGEDERKEERRRGGEEERRESGRDRNSPPLLR